MEKIKKTLLMIATGLVGCTTIMVAATNNSSILETSIAGLTKSNTNDRTLTLNSSTPLNIDNGVGTLTVGNIGVYATNCENLNGGVAKMNSSCNIYLYCATADLDSNNRYYGFGGSTISSVTFVVNNHGNTAGNINMSWTKLNNDFTRSGYISNTSLALQSSQDNQTITVNGSNVFLTGQGGENNCIYIYYSKSTLDLISLTVEYSCK